MEIKAKKFSLPKKGSSQDEYEDACNFAPEQGRFAVADGATETSFSGIWAKQLVRAFKNKELSVPITFEELKPLQNKWQNNVRRRPLPWYAEEKVNEGAFAAFVGLEILEKNSGAGTEKTWRATAAGDSCLVHIRENSVLRAFPLEDSVSFNNRPNLICSVPIFNGQDILTSANGSWNQNDEFFLMTDALACWFFKEHEQKHEPWNILRDLDASNQSSFESWISRLRAEGQMRNDDVTLLQITTLT